MPQHPHREPWYTRMLDLFGRRSSPVYIRDGYEGTDEQSAAAPGVLGVGSDRHQRYRIFDEMDNFDLVQSVHTTMAEDATIKDPNSGYVIWIESTDSEVQKEGMRCLNNVQASNRAFQTARNLSKYGDVYYRLIYETGKGVVGMRFVHPTKMERFEGQTGVVNGYKETGVSEYRGELKRDISWPWDYVHGRLVGGKHDIEGYGTSISEPMFRPWRQMTLTEDSMLMFRLGRVPTRMLVQVHVGSMPEHEARSLTRSFEKKFRKTEFIDPATASYSKQFNPLTPMEDVFLPMYENREHRIDQMVGGGDIGEIHDVEYYSNKFFGSTGAPKSFFGFDETGDGGKARLTQQSIRWANSGKRIQNASIAMYRQILDTHFALYGKDIHDKAARAGYVIHMTPISYLDEVERLELLSTRYQLVEQLVRLAEDLRMDVRVWAAYVLMQFARLPEELVLRLLQSKDDTEPTVEEDAQRSPREKRVAESLIQQVKLLTPDEIEKMNKVFGESQILKDIVVIFKQYRGIGEISVIEQGRIQADPSTLPPIEGLALLVEDDERTVQLQSDLLEVQKLQEAAKVKRLEEGDEKQ